MKTKTNINRERRLLSFMNSLFIKSVILCFVFLSATSAPVNAQVTPAAKHLWSFGIVTGTNVNFYRSSTQELNSTFSTPVVFDNGKGAGLFLAPVIEFHQPGSSWSIML